MLRKLATFATSILLGNLLLFAGAKASLAGTVLENIARSGKFNVGTSFQLIPYSYYNDKDEHVGYSIDIIKLIRDSLEKELGRSIELNFIETNSIAELFPKLASGEIDITCNTVFTWDRDAHADFTTRYAISGVRLLTKKEQAQNSSWEGKRIGVPAITFLDDVMKLKHPKATLVTLNSPEEAVEALKSGEVDAIAGDSIILDGYRQRSGADDYRLLPSREDPPYAQYGVACMVPENNSAFLNIANKAIITMMEGYIVGEPKYTDLVGTWFGPKGVIQVQNPELVKQFFDSIILNYEQIPF